MDFFLVLTQGLFGLVCFTMPGLALLSLWGRRSRSSWPCAFVLAASYVLSSILIAGWEMAALNLFDPLIARALTWVLVIGILLYTVRVGWKTVASYIAPMGMWERRALVLIVAVVIGLLLTMPLSPYPSQISLQLGDPPSYYQTATNLVAGRGWQPDYTIGDYLAGTLSYLTAQPIPVLVTAFFFQLFGTNWYSLYVYDDLAGGMLIYLLATFVCWRLGKVTIDGRQIFILVFVCASLPSFFILFGLGVVTAPGALVFMVITALLLVRTTPRALRYLVSLGAILFLLGVRPEVALLAMLLILGYGIFKMFTAPIHRAARPIGLFVHLVASVSFWANITAIVDAFPSPLHTLGIFYLRFDPVQGQFTPMYIPPHQLNHKLSQVNFGELTVDEIKNGAIGLELRGHPVEFIRFWLEGLGDTAATIMPAFSFPEDIGIAPLLALTILGTVGALAAVDAAHRLVVAVIIAFFLCLPLLNFGAGVRHYLTVTPVLVALALRVIIQNRWRRTGDSTTRVRRSTIWIATGLMGLIVVLNFSRLIGIRLAAENTSYVSILQDIQTVTPPNSLIASSYPQLITCVTGRPSVGTTWLAEDVEPVVNKYAPESVLIDNARWSRELYASGEKERLDDLRLRSSDAQRDSAIHIVPRGSFDGIRRELLSFA